MTAIISSLGLLLLGCVLLSQTRGSESSVHGDVDKRGYTYTYERSSYACEDSFIVLTCDLGSVIRVNETCWGGKRGTQPGPGGCSPNADTCRKISSECFSDVKERVNTQCDGARTCQFQVSSNTLGNTPCQNHARFLEVYYTCERTASQSSHNFEIYACENNFLNLACMGNKKVKIHYAHYGRRTSRNYCDPQVLGINKASRTCDNDVTDDLIILCNGKSFCHFQLTDHINFTLSDPCENVFKYIFVTYCCQSTDDRTG